jgi:hypothetical protein
MEFLYPLDSINPKVSHIVTLVREHSVMDIIACIRKGVAWEDFFKVQEEIQIDVDQMLKLLHLTRDDLKLKTLPFNASDRFWLMVHLYHIGYGIKKAMQPFIDWMKSKLEMGESPLELCCMGFMAKQIEMDLVRELMEELKKTQGKARKQGKGGMN